MLEFPQNRHRIAASAALTEVRLAVAKQDNMPCNSDNWPAPPL
jgi:hypothetical protein